MYNSFPIVLIAHTFSFLTFNESHLIKRVCKDWNNIANKSGFLTEFVYENNYHIDYIRLLHQHRHHIKTLIVNGISDLELWIGCMRLKPLQIHLKRCSFDNLNWVPNSVKKITFEQCYDNVGNEYSDRKTDGPNTVIDKIIEPSMTGDYYTSGPVSITA